MGLNRVKYDRSFFPYELCTDSSGDLEYVVITHCLQNLALLVALFSHCCLQRVATSLRVFLHAQGSKPRLTKYMQRSGRCNSKINDLIEVIKDTDLSALTSQPQGKSKALQGALPHAH